MSAPPGLYAAATTRLPALGNADGHIVEAIGKGYTAFPGYTAADLYADLRAGQTAAQFRDYRPRELWCYLRFSMRQQARPSVPHTATSG